MTMTDRYSIGDRISAVACSRMDTELIKTLWSRSCSADGKLSIQPCCEPRFQIGSTEPPILSPRAEYALRVNESGISLVGRDYSGLMRGFFSLLMKIVHEDGTDQIAFAEEQGEYRIQNRMLHICIFPETDLYFIRKLIRLAALCQYTHVVIEFWGMLQYDCLKELAWQHAYSKEEIRGVIAECRMLGIEPIPMFNHLGHASASRVRYGKHVVLDQNMDLRPLFTPDGWVWNYQSPRVTALLRQVRSELYELFGEGSYFHLGCDEAYYVTRNAALRKELPSYLNRLTSEVEKEGRKPMIWMDMLLERDHFARCYATGDPEEVPLLRQAVSSNTVFVDWQYDCNTAPIPSLLSLKDCGHDCIGASWFSPKNIDAHIQTVSEHAMAGMMLTTWHTLSDQISSILYCAKQCGAHTFSWSESSQIQAETATMLRLVSTEGNTYASSGWAKEQIRV